MSPKVEQAIAHEAGARVGRPLFADSLGPGVSYIGSIEANTRAIVEGFRSGGVRSEIRTLSPPPPLPPTPLPPLPTPTTSQPLDA